MFKRIDKGLWYTIGICIIFIVFFYYKLLININSVYFVDSGDGIQSYYGVIYHVKYGSSLLHFEGLNYPYGENFFFSVNPANIGLVLKLINTFINISPYTLGVINGFVFLSLIFCSIFIYLILTRFIQNNIYKILLPVLITFICPQIYRMGGHYSLASLFVIPGILWFVSKFDELPSFKLSIIIALYTFFVATLHLYFFAFSVLIWVIYYIYKTLLPTGLSFKKIGLRFIYLIIQVVLPYIFINFLINLDVKILDRTKTPFGLLVYKNNFNSVFYPFGRIYENFISWFINPGPIGDGGFEFIGIVAALTLAFLILRFSINIFKLNKSKLLNPFNDPIINFLGFVAIISLLISFAYPFEQRYGKVLLDNVGLFKQFRGIARFSWITYFSTSIIAVYLIFAKQDRIWLKLVCVLLLFTDVYGTNYSIQEKYNNKIEELSDTDNNIELNRWMKLINPKDYQAILVFPNYNNGSENVYDERGSWVLRYGMISSLKTGLPLIPIHLSRTSISQAQSNFNLVQEPYRYPIILEKFKKDKKILIISLRSKINEDEQNFLNDCDLLNSNIYFDYYEISMEKLNNRFENLYTKKLKEINEKQKIENIYNSKSYYFNDFENHDTTIGYNSKGSRTHPLQHYLTFFEDTLPSAKRGEYLISFWVGNFKKDLVPRSYYSISIRDKFNRYYEDRLSILGREFKIIDNDWALIESTISLNNPDDIVKLTIWNTELKEGNTIVDRLLIKPINTNVYYFEGKNIYFNNRVYLFSNK